MERVERTKIILDKQYFIYSTGILSIGAHSTVTHNLQISADADFDVYEIKSNLAILNAVGNIVNITFNIVNLGTGKSFFNEHVPVQSIASTGNNQRRLKKPIEIQANSTLQFLIKNNTVNIVSLDITLEGAKVYRAIPIKR